MDQLEFPLFQRVDAPAVAPEQWVRYCKTYREAVIAAWTLRTMKGAKASHMAAKMGFHAQHVSDWFAKDHHPKRRSLPANLIPDFESYVGNTLVSQWLASKADLTVFEQAIATKACA
jgi:hypothetical protein